MCFKVIATYSWKQNPTLVHITFYHILAVWLWRIQKSFRIQNLISNKLYRCKFSNVNYTNFKYIFFYSANYIITYGIILFGVLYNCVTLHLNSFYARSLLLLYFTSSQSVLLLKLPLFFSFTLY